MKKIFSVLLLLVAMFALVACDNTEGNDKNSATITGATDVTINIGDTFDPMSNVKAEDTVDGNITTRIEVSGTVLTNTAGTYTLTYSVEGSDGKVTTVKRVVTVSYNHSTPPTEIVIMHGAPYEVDPFDAAFSGSEQQVRQQRQREVEARLNVKIVYKAYPAAAAWGPSRVSAIINASVAGDPLADILWTTSDWTAQLANASAIVPVDQYLTTTGTNITQEAKDLGKFKEQLYAFSANKPTVDVGLYFNIELVNDLGIENPAELYNNGEWTWSKFEQWAEAAKAELSSVGDDYKVLGGVRAVYAENMIPLNGGSLINSKSLRVAFAQKEALETYSFIYGLVNKGLFEGSGTYDSGSPLWQSGKVVMHPGSYWFLNAENRWKGLEFDLGFVPYPSSDTYSGQYVSPISGVAVYTLSSGLGKDKEALAFQVWNEIQLWKNDVEFENEFRDTLIKRFNDEASIDAYLSVFDKTTLDLTGALGISKFAANGWYGAANLATSTGDARAAMDAILATYEDALDSYLGR
ncbi:extracellular solute-binding protein [Acholeplasma laidlawii]|uniref:extracellular solute-binding protein n=1 Tax=Acholeplasma laidlawii TaxID=2148 RepID=UPI003F91A908